MLEHTDPRLRLCAATDDLRDDVSGLLLRATAAQHGGATMLLLRLKHADTRTLVEVGHALVAGVTIPVMVSDRLDVALACGAAGVHLSAAAMPVPALRPHLPAGMLVGATAHSDADLARVSGADYVTIGPVFGADRTALGVAELRRLVALCPRPVMAIGGMEPAVLGEVRATGARGVAALRSILGSADPAGAAAALSAAWGA